MAVPPDPLLRRCPRGFGLGPDEPIARVIYSRSTFQEPAWKSVGMGEALLRCSISRPVPSFEEGQCEYLGLFLRVDVGTERSFRVSDTRPGIRYPAVTGESVGHSSTVPLAIHLKCSLCKGIALARAPAPLAARQSSSALWQVPRLHTHSSRVACRHNQPTCWSVGAGGIYLDAAKM